ncbi:VOC family protein [Hyphomonas sp.]|uniref:VOC family protein n=1 Tax=Hyphomonas sp. TaxID=87 RepID=UPI000AD700AA|nr:VOC family protein [Hyphomonas sp.]
MRTQTIWMIPRGAGRVFLAAAAWTLASCASARDTRVEIQDQARETLPMTPAMTYFEIPVTDMDRAVQFYTSVFGVSLTREIVDGYDMALFPPVEDGWGASGALAKGDVYVPSKTGAILYFRVASIDDILARATAAGAGILYPKKDIGELGFVAEIEDSEGNRIALTEQKI